MSRSALVYARAVPDVHRDDGYDPDRWDAAFIVARDGPRDLEPGVYRRTLASLNSGWLARGGLLRLHDDHLSFVPTPIERLLFAKNHRITFASIDAIIREPARPEDVLPGGRSPRMKVQTGKRSYEFVFLGGLDDWIDAVGERRRIWENRTRMRDGNS
jgi:hypothetical protein